ncbi:MAG: ABC transporter ATP-binding protein [Oscillospiraceae bacterium]
MKQPLVELENLSKSYPVKNRQNPLRKHQIKAVNNLSLSVGQGEVFGLVGESGCGKSTLGQMLAGLLPPTAGKILYKGKSAGQMTAKEKKAMRLEIQIVLQDPYASLNPKHKIGWLVEEPLAIHTGLSAPQRKKRAAEMLETVGLDAGYLNRYPHELSGGQRQRVSIAAALMLAPLLLVADEAVSALDVSVQSQILNLLKNLKEQKKLTYLFISHDLNVVQYMSDRIGVMYLGQLVEYGSVEQVYGNARHPYTRALLSAVPSVGGGAKTRIVLEGEVPSLLNPPAGCAFFSRCRLATPFCAQHAPAMQQVAEGHCARCHFAREEGAKVV